MQFSQKVASRKRVRKQHYSTAGFIHGLGVFVEKTTYSRVFRHSGNKGFEQKILSVKVAILVQ
ncbi:MAG: hypothetical protein DSY77_10205 [Bacteroidetes bacterium]|nr:MAG: hypothetical protein DSY77_10205 [Bacteroidota bacterium]